MYWHWQNLNEGGSPLRYGRAWLHWGPHGGRCLGWEWSFRKFAWLGLKVSRGGCDHDYQLSIGLLLVSFYVILSGIRPWKALPRNWSREYGIQLAGEHLALHWNHDDSESPPKQGFYRSWLLLDVLLGRSKYSQGEGQPVRASVRMPEGRYPCTVTLSTDTWRRPRWPFARRVARASIEVPGGIPIPGKGENSWDCGDDAIFGMTRPADSVELAVAGLRDSALRTRERYGGRNWTPVAGWPESIRTEAANG